MTTLHRDIRQLDIDTSARAPGRRAAATGKPPATAPWAAYGRAKATVERAGLTPTAYARAIRRLARRMGV